MEGMIVFLLIFNVWYDCFSIDYQRFRSDASKNRSYSSDSTIEYLHLCEKF